jgi:hypothetical protein
MSPLGAATAAVRAGRKALALVAGDTEVSYLVELGPTPAASAQW